MVSCAGDTSSICEELDKFTFKEPISHDGGWKFFDESGLYDSVESSENNTRSDIYYHKNNITKRIFYSRVNKLTHLIRDPKENLLFVIERNTGSIFELDLNKTTDGEKDVAGFPKLAQIKDAWQLCINSTDNERAIVCISTIRNSPQTVTYISGKDVKWEERFKEIISQACVLNTLDVVVINDKCIIKLSRSNGRRIKMIRSGFEGFEIASGVCSVPGGGFLVSDDQNRRICSFSNDLIMKNKLNLDFRPTDIYVSDKNHLFMAKGKRKPYTSYIFDLTKTSE